MEENHFHAKGYFHPVGPNEHLFRFLFAKHHHVNGIYHSVYLPLDKWKVKIVNNGTDTETAIYSFEYISDEKPIKALDHVKSLSLKTVLPYRFESLNRASKFSKQMIDTREGRLEFHRDGKLISYLVKPGIKLRKFHENWKCYIYAKQYGEAKYPAQ